MANIDRTPFIVPRPREETPLWQGTPQPSDTLLMLTAQKLYGAGGEVKTQLWRWDHVPDPVWTGTPLASDALVMLTAQKLFGAGGEFVPPQWPYTYVQDITPSWEAPPVNELLLKPAGAPFIASQWSYTYVADVAPSWEPPPVNELLLKPTAAPFVRPQWPDTYIFETPWTWPPQPAITRSLLVNLIGGQLIQADTPAEIIGWNWQAPFNENLLAAPAAVSLGGAQLVPADTPAEIVGWSWRAAANENLLAPQTVPFVAEAWAGGYVADPIWLGTPQANRSILNITPTWRQWRQDYDSGATAWVWKAPSSNTLSVLVEGGTPQHRLWRYDHDSGAAFWLGAPSAFSLPLYPVGAPFARQWRYDHDSGATAWTWQAPASNTLSVLIEGGAPFARQWRYDLTPEPVWTGTPQAAITRFLLVSLGGAQLVPADMPAEIVGWNWQPLSGNENLLAGPPGTPFFRQWRYDYDSAATAWTWQAPISNTLSVLIEGGAPQHRFWRYDLDSGETRWTFTAPPVSQPLLAAAIEPFFKQWRYDLTPEPFWPATPQRSFSVTLATTEQKFFAAPGQAPTKLWRYDFDSDVRQWAWAVPPVSQPLLQAAIEPFSRQWRYDFTPEPVWQGAPVSTHTLPILSAGGAPQHQLWRYDLDNDVRLWSWSGTAPFIANIAVATPFAKLWRYDQIAATEWTWRVPAANYPPSGVLAPTKLWRYDPVPSPDWNWQSPAANYPLFGGQVPTKPWRYDQVPTTEWVWKAPVSAPLTMLGGRPFARLWRYDYESGATWWLGQASPWPLSISFPVSQIIQPETNPHFVGRFTPSRVYRFRFNTSDLLVAPIPNFWVTTGVRELEAIAGARQLTAEDTARSINVVAEPRYTVAISGIRKLTAEWDDE